MNSKYILGAVAFSLVSITSVFAQTVTPRLDHLVPESVASKAPDACAPNTLLKDLKPGTVIEVLNRFSVYDTGSEYIVFQSGAEWGSLENISEDVMEKDIPACKLLISYPIDGRGDNKTQLGFVVPGEAKWLVQGTTASNGISLRADFITQINCGTEGFEHQELATVETLSRAMLGNAGESNIIVHCPR